jgi:ferrous iron transport protein B
MSFTFALVGNPNTGKSSLFNQLTGLRQKTGNFPGVTVDKKTGSLQLSKTTTANLIDLPGTYSLYPNSQDERIVLNILANPSDANFPDAIIYIADLTNLERHLLLFTQIKDLGFPLILVLNMLDLAENEGILLDKKQLSDTLKVPVIGTNGRTGLGSEELKSAMLQIVERPRIVRQSSPFENIKSFYTPTGPETRIVEKIRFVLPEANQTYRTILWAHHYTKLPFLDNNQKELIDKEVKSEEYQELRQQITETLQRFERIQPIIQKVIQKPTTHKNSLTDKIDKIVTHNIFGPLIFFGILFFIFQSIFAWAEYPKDGIEFVFNWSKDFLRNHLPDTWLSQLLTNGIIPGLSGVLVFIPQITILFFMISILEELGYMARSVYLFDRIMQKFGLNGRSIVSLVSGGACAIPAIMSTRTISNWKERLITILVTPLISCSARIPVYALLVGMFIPNKHVFGIIGYQGLAFTGLYVLSIVSALLAAYVFSKIIKTDESTFLMMELPEYRLPHWKNVFITVWEKVKSFVQEAGKTILIISIVLWFLASFGPSGQGDKAQLEAQKQAVEQKLDPTQTKDLIASKRLEVSFAGHLGHAIEPVIKPLGFDWKIGIALISSFAAREVFVGTMATIYSIGSNPDDTASIADRMRNEKSADGKPIYTLASAMSLLIFYVFAMQCMSTMAVTKRETKSWKWPIVQFLYMGILAYLGSLATFLIFSA